MSSRTPARNPVARRTHRRLPAAVIALAGVGLVLVVLPLVGLLMETPWSSLGQTLTSPAATAAIRVSVIVSLAATAIVALVGTPLAWLIVQLPSSIARFVRAVVLLPMVMPPVVGGTALLMAFGRRSPLGQVLDRVAGISLPFTVAGAIVAATFVALPFFVIAVEPALSDAHRQWGDAASTLGARPGMVLGRIVLPVARPAIIAGSALAWARALGEFGATITFNGSLGGRTQTLPLATYEAIESGDRATALALSIILLVVSMTVLVAMRDRWVIR